MIVYVQSAIQSSFQTVRVRNNKCKVQGCKSGLAKKFDTLQSYLELHINQSDASIYSLHRKVSDYSDNLNSV